MLTPSNAVFLSYASEDAAAAQRIAEALRAAGIEVWFDKSELRGGDVWDRRIREQIHDCRLFVPVISAQTEAREEGYFRREWRLAVERAGDMAEDRAFLLPVAIDGMNERTARVPDSFRHVQWTSLPGGETSPAFVERIRRLLAPDSASAHPAAAVASPGSTDVPEPSVSASRSKLAALTIAALLVLALGYVAIDKFRIAKRSPVAATAVPATPAFAPPPHSIAVLPFVNMSGDKEQEYFSDGLTEELLNSLAGINELQVAARTSAFSFKGTNTDIGTIARKLNVGAVLEGSVRRSANTIRITAQLINAVTGFHLWSKSYDRALGDVLKLQTEIATAVAGALKVTLLGDVAAKVELGGTRNPAAFDAYLRGRKAYLAAHGGDYQKAIAAFTEAIGLDPNYALAFANRSLALSGTPGPDVQESFDRAQSDARKAIALAADLAEGHLALAVYFDVGSLEFTRANEEYERALALAPGNARVLRDYSIFAGAMRRTEAGIAAARRAVLLDPLNPDSHIFLGMTLDFGRQHKEALAAYQDALALDPEDPQTYVSRGFAYYGLGDLESARASCETKPDFGLSQQCLAVIYNKLGRHADAEAELSKLKAAQGDAMAYQYATIYAQWGNRAQALEWLETALRLRDPGVESVKTDPLLDPLRKEPRFQAIELALKFPD